MPEKSSQEAADVSVIMPAWRSAATIGRALGSVARQTVRPREVIVVDDGSDDDTASAAEEMRAALAPVALTVFRQENQVPGGARNRAIENSSGSLLAFLDADDEWLPRKLECSLEAPDQSGVDLIAHNILVHDRSLETVFECARHLKEGEDVFVALFKRGFVATTSVICRRDAVEAVDGFDTSLRSPQDYELWMAIAALEGRRFAVLPEALARYFTRAGSVSSNIELRRRCSIKVAHRHMAALCGRVKYLIGVLVYRLSVIAAEAIIGHLRRGEVLKAVVPLAAWPVNVASNVVRFLLGLVPTDTASRQRG